MTLTFPNSNVTAEVHRTEVAFVSIRSNEPGSTPVVLNRSDCWDLLIHFLAVTDKAKSEENNLQNVLNGSTSEGSDA